MNYFTEKTPWRWVLCSLASLAAALMTGCEDHNPQDSQPGGTANGGSSNSAPLVILTWDEYFSPEVIEEFEKEFGIKVEFVNFSNLDEQEALLRSRPSEFDLALTSGVKMADLISMQLVQPIQKDLLPLFGNMDERFLGMGSDPENQYSVPYMWGPTLIAYRADKIAEPAKAWRSLWDDRYRGHILMLDEPFDAYAAALLALGSDINSQEPVEIEAATKGLLDQVQRLDARFVDIDEVREELLSGDCWITMTYSSDAGVLAEKEENISYFIPEEGASLWLDSFVIPRESRNSRAAHDFLNYFCRPEVAAANSNELWCASANREARQFISEEIKEDPTIYLSDEILARCELESRASVGRQTLVNRGMKLVFDRLQATARDTESVSKTAAVTEDESSQTSPGGED
ncbi:MAG: spermidine/putrescine ABC transporter substrate-binding protein [Verrucomicrobiae bacterium]|nr:spermidine/putrescine ABC transporter substrate-binding protein [Verrucomicrobiae bacterium]